MTGRGIFMMSARPGVRTGASGHHLVAREAGATGRRQFTVQCPGRGTGASGRWLRAGIGRLTVEI